MAYFEKLKDKGNNVEHAIKIILEEMEDGVIDEDHAELFAIKLDRKVGGSFIIARRERSFKFNGMAIRNILGNFYNKKAHSLISQVIFDNLLRALKEAELDDIAERIRDEWKGDNGPDISASASAGQAYRKKITGLPDTLYIIPNLQKRPTASFPTPSDQGRFPVCTSHAVGKGVVAILEDCGFDITGGQQRVIDDLIQQVQPTKQAEDPDRFNEEIIRLGIKKDGTSFDDVAVKINIQTDYAPSPKPIDASVRKENKIHMILRAEMPSEHAIFAKDYDFERNHYDCINSWGNKVESRPNAKVPRSKVYAVDYIQIAEEVKKN